MGYGWLQYETVASCTSRLIVLRDEKLLDPGRDLIHYLGTSKLEWATAFTAIQRNIRKTINPNMLVTFDAASPFITTAKGQAYSQHVHQQQVPVMLWKKQLMIKDSKTVKLHFHSTVLLVSCPTWATPTIWDPGMKNKIGKEGKSAWDTCSYFLLMAHNVYQHIESVQRAML